jgi:hypothetical protein
MRSKDVMAASPNRLLSYQRLNRPRRLLRQ